MKDFFFEEKLGDNFYILLFIQIKDFFLFKCA